MALLNLGCGDVIADEWTNCDRQPIDGAARCDPMERLPWDDEHFDGVLADHVLQMVPWLDLVPWLAEVRRVLVVGGVLRLIVPDVLAAFDAYRNDMRSWFPVSSTLAPDVDSALALYVMQAGASRSIFTPMFLMRLCDQAGFRRATVGSHGVVLLNDEIYGLADLDSRRDESFIIEAQK